MAEKRMFSKAITESDAFLDMALSTQALYFHLCMYADDDGFLSGYRKIMRMCGAAQTEYDVLLAKKFILEFDDGIVVIKHWLMHNYLRKDRYKPTSYTKEKEMLFVKENKAYTLDESQGVPLGIPTGAPTGIPLVDVDKSSIDKSREEKKKNSALVDAFFEKHWKLYPSKKGKGKISATQKKKLYALGDEFERCITRYIEYANSLDYAYHYQNGSTFFNSGYVDYLDENYEEQKPKKQTPKIDRSKVVEVTL